MHPAVRYVALGAKPNYAKLVAALVAAYSGALYDVSDDATVFQDSAGTTPVAVDGDPCGMLRDKGPLGCHVVQAVGGARPTYRRGSKRWLYTDGADDLLQTATASYGSVGGTHYMAIAVTRAVQLNQQFISVQQSSSLYHRLSNSSSNTRLTARVNSGNSGFVSIQSPIASSPLNAPIVGETQWLGTTGKVASNSSVWTSATNTADGTAINPCSIVIGIGAQEANFYGAVLLKGAPTDAERAVIRAFLMSKMV